MKTAVVTVLKMGGPLYDARWVFALERGLKATNPDAQLIVLTDHDALLKSSFFGGRGSPIALPLNHDLPGWWSKLELFSPKGLAAASGLYDRFLYVDLDTLVTGDLSDLMAWDGKDIVMLSDFFRPKLAQSGVMLFRLGERTASAWDEFMADPPEKMRAYGGDGEFLYDVFDRQVERIQDLFPDQVVSLKVHAVSQAPKNARLVCGHGRPRLNAPAAGWAYQAWLAGQPPSAAGPSPEEAGR